MPPVAGIPAQASHLSAAIPATTPGFDRETIARSVNAEKSLHSPLYRTSPTHKPLYSKDLPLQHKQPDATIHLLPNTALCKRA